jgi:CBS domain containing-hemolysin-like protein
MKLVYILLMLAVIKCIAIYKLYHSIPILELKRRARTKDHRASRLYKVAVYEASLDVLLWILGTACAVALVIWSARTNWWLATIVIAATGWLIVWGRFSADGWPGRVAAMAAPAYAWLLSFAQPVLGRLAHWLPVDRMYIHTGLYEKRDLLDLLAKQNQQVDNRIPENDLEIAFNSLQFGDKTVSSAMTPRRKVKLVSANDSIGPILVDELHKTGFSRFPVVKDSVKLASPEVIGTLHLSDLVGYDGNGKIKDLAEHKVFFINEDANLRQALAAFLKTHHHLLIVVNSFEEMVGVLSLEDVLEQIIGKQIVDEFDNYASLRAVAAIDAKADQAEHEEVKPEQTAEEVVN